jgi:hypothetical protein
MLAGGMGAFLVKASGCHPEQAEAMIGFCRVDGMLSRRQFTIADRCEEMQFTARAIAIAEAWLPIYTANAVRHQVLHFFDEGGWAELLGPARSLQK